MFRLSAVCVLLYVFFARLAAAQNTGKRAYLTELTIYRTKETRLVFRNRPEVYLSCHDGLPNFDLKRVRRTDKLYVFEEENQAYTAFGPSRCVTCRLEEADRFTEDDTFGTWVMCEEHFQLTGNHTIYVNDQFTATFSCPKCKFEEIEPSIPPSEPPVDSPEESLEEIEVEVPGSETEVDALGSEIEVDAPGSDIEEDEDYFMAFDKDTFSDTD